MARNDRILTDCEKKSLNLKNNSGYSASWHKSCIITSRDVNLCLYMIVIYISILRTSPANDAADAGKDCAQTMNSTNMLSRSALALSALAFLSFGNAARAQVTFSDRALFTTATPGASSFNFNGFAPTGFANYPNGIVVQGLAFKAVGTDNFGLTASNPNMVVGNPFNGSTFIYSSGVDALDVLLPSGVTAFGADFSNYGTPSGATVTATVMTVKINDTIFTYTFDEPGAFPTRPGDPTSVFFGIVSAIPITSLSFTNDDGGTAMDNVRFSRIGGSAVPEPGSVALLVSVMTVGAGLFRKRRK